MPALKSIASAVFLLVSFLSLLTDQGVAAQADPPSLHAPPTNVTHTAAGAPHGSHELPLHPVEIGHIAGLPITNSMLVTWIVALALIVFAQLATRRIEAVPRGIQNFWEW